jgi:hypothetical protein
LNNAKNMAKHSARYGRTDGSFFPLSVRRRRPAAAKRNAFALPGKWLGPYDFF